MSVLGWLAGDAPWREYMRLVTLDLEGRGLVCCWWCLALDVTLSRLRDCCQVYTC